MRPGNPGASMLFTHADRGLENYHSDVLDSLYDEDGKPIPQQLAMQWWDRQDESHPDLDWARGDRVDFDTPELSPEGKRQYDEVVARYTNPDGTKKTGWMKTPNGKPTRLTERQWVQVRTPNFKRWFGDWEALALRNAIEATSDIAFSRPTGGLLYELVEGYRRGDTKIERRIIDWAMGIIPKSVKNVYIGDVVTSRGNIRSILHHVRDARSRGPLKVLVLEKMEEVLKNSVLVSEGEDGSDYFYNLAHRMSFDGVPYIARLIVKKDRNGNMTYDVEFSWKEKLSNAPATGTGALDESKANPAHSTTENVLQSLYAVNPENASKVVDENGEPLVVWHGSRWNPLAEEKGNAVFRTGEGETGAGAHFGTRAAAKERAEGQKFWDITACHLNIRNPIEVSDTGYWTPGDVVAEVRKTEQALPGYS